MPSNIAGKYLNTLPIQDRWGNLPPGEYVFLLDINGGEYTEPVIFKVSTDHKVEFRPLRCDTESEHIVVRQG